jgi:hypothetical protein
MNFNYKQNYQIQLEEGQRFQDHCAYWLQKTLNIGIVNFQTKEYQYKFGENMQGIELKFDKVFQTTSNLWIETAERHNPDTPYSDSGIFRKDNSWLYCIGNYEVIYIFQKSLLVFLYQTGRYPLIENKLMTSKGFLLPKSSADKYAAAKIATKTVVNETAEGKSDQISYKI